MGDACQNCRLSKRIYLAEFFFFYSVILNITMDFFVCIKVYLKVYVNVDNRNTGHVLNMKQNALKNSLLRLE